MESHARFYYLHRFSGVFYIEVLYGAGSFASSNRADADLAFWKERGLCADLVRETEKAIAEWPCDSGKRAVVCYKCDPPVGNGVGMCQRPNDCMGMAKGGA